eukprot:1148103-Pelagomonas_calceolata.AAC.9
MPPSLLLSLLLLWLWLRDRGSAELPREDSRGARGSAELQREDMAEKPRGADMGRPRPLSLAARERG